MTAPRVQAFVGLRCSGKSSLARRWAERTGAPFADLDDLLVELVGGEDRTAGDLLLTLGEVEFRTRETRALAEFLNRDLPGVLATGGGAILSPANRAILRERCLVIWLDAPPEVLAERLRNDDTARPSLTGGDPAEELHQLAGEREPLYRELADVRLDATKPLEELERELGSKLRRLPDGGLVLTA